MANVLKGRRLLTPVVTREPAVYGRLTDRGMYFSRRGFLGPAVPRTGVSITGPALVTAPSTATYTLTLENVETEDVVVEVEAVDITAVYGVNYEWSVESSPGRTIGTIQAGTTTANRNMQILLADTQNLDYRVRLRRIVSGPGIITQPNQVTTTIQGSVGAEFRNTEDGDQRILEDGIEDRILEFG